MTTKRLSVFILREGKRTSHVYMKLLTTLSIHLKYSGDIHLLSLPTLPIYLPPSANNNLSLHELSSPGLSPLSKTIGVSHRRLSPFIQVFFSDVCTYKGRSFKLELYRIGLQRTRPLYLIRVSWQEHESDVIFKRVHGNPLSVH